jgi:hypothetical protein
MKSSARYLAFTIPVLALLVAVALPSAATADNEFVGSKVCKKCHLKQYKSWEATLMAQSFENLRAGNKAEEKTAAGLDAAMDYTTDAKCLTCHTVGYGKPGGFVSEAETPDHMGVGCENCHGAGSAYTAEEVHSLKNKEFKQADVEAAGMIVVVGEAQCVACHNSDSPFFKVPFDFAALKDEGNHEHFALKYEHDN